MATVTVNEIIEKCQIILQDTTSTRWPMSELVGWMNDAYREIIKHRPDANTESNVFRCAEGTHQRLNKARYPASATIPPEGSGGFPNAIALKAVLHNRPYNGAENIYETGRTVRQIDRRILDDQRPGWHTEPATDEIQHFIFEPSSPLDFWVYPQASEDAALQIIFASVPEGHDQEINYGSATPIPGTAPPVIPNQITIRLVDSYANVILDYILYRAYSKDADYAANAQRAMNHFNAMLNSLGLKTQVDNATNPQDHTSGLRSMRRQQQEM